MRNALLHEGVHSISLEVVLLLDLIADLLLRLSSLHPPDVVDDLILPLEVLAVLTEGPEDLVCIQNDHLLVALDHGEELEKLDIGEDAGALGLPSNHTVALLHEQRSVSHEEVDPINVRDPLPNETVLVVACGVLNEGLAVRNVEQAVLEGSVIASPIRHSLPCSSAAVW